MKIKKNENRIVNPKNYLILLLSIVGTIIVSIYILSWYKQYHDILLDSPVILETLSQVKENELDNVLRERDSILIYSCTTSEYKCRSFEEKFNEYIIDNDLADNMVYLNLGDDSDKDGVLNRVYSNYKHQGLIKKINSYPAMFVVNNGEIVDVLSSDDSISIFNVEEFLKGYDIE